MAALINALALILLIVPSNSYSSYSSYYIEDDCLMGNERIFYKLDSSSAAVIKASRQLPYQPYKNCTITLMPAGSTMNYGIVLSIRQIDFFSHSLQHCTDYIQVLGNSQHVEKILCGYSYDYNERRSYGNRDNLTFLYHTERRITQLISEVGFEAIATVHTYVPCLSNQYRCDNDRCIWKGLKCDGHNNCGDNSDEDEDMCIAESVQSGILRDYITMIAFCVMVVFLVITFTIFCRLRRNRPVQTIIATGGTGTSRTPYEAMFPGRFSISENPAGPNRLYSPPVVALPKKQEELGFSNPCYPTGSPHQSPPPPYKP